MSDFLPISIEEVKARGWSSIDFLFISGDAYVDHPSFGPAIISRVLESNGYKVGILAQPDWHNLESFTVLGKPNYAVLISSGNLDSMLCHYTAAKKRRHEDKYSPGGIAGKRPDHATVVYTQKIKEIWPDIPVIIGGIEASLRRFIHYDYWENKLLPSILEDSGADLLIYGMGEKQIVEIADYLAGGTPINEIRYIRGTSYSISLKEKINFDECIELPSWQEIHANRINFAKAYKLQSKEQDPFYGKIVIQKGIKKIIVQNQNIFPLSMSEMDAIYDIDYKREYHPSYKLLGGIPALEEVKFSIISCRGCFGSCSFCAIHAHQGRIIQARSHESILKEAEILVKLPDFKGYIHDVGGPTANFRHPACNKQLKVGTCRDKQCLFPEPCVNLNSDHSDYIDLLKKIRTIPGIKKVFIRSGIRYDYLLCEKDRKFLHELCAHHISGQLKVAPEHVDISVLKLMGKPSRYVYDKFMTLFKNTNKKLGLNQFLVPYFISSHPGSTIKSAISLAEFLRDIKYQPQQVQDFIPTPGSASTAMYYSGVDVNNFKPLFVARKLHDKALQRALIQYKNPRNYRLVKEALISAGRKDLIGDDKRCLIRK